MKRKVILGSFLVLACMIPLPGRAVIVCSDLIISVDVPTTFSTISTTLEAYQALRCTNNAYNTPPIFFDGSGLGAGVNIVSLASLSPTEFIFTVDAPVKIGAANCPSTGCTSSCNFETRDIIKATNESGTWKYCMYIDNPSGLGAGTVIDSLALASNGTDLLMSFDVPTTLGGTTYSQNDIVKYNVVTSTWSSFLRGVDLFLPNGTNVVGFEVLAFHPTDNLFGDYVYMFDVPTTTNNPGGLNGARTRWGWRHFEGNWDPVNPFFKDDGIPEGNLTTDFMISAVPGDVKSNSLRISKNGTNLNLSWQNDCANNQYEIYEGTIGSYYSHNTQISCQIVGTSTTITPSAGNKYYLVVARRYNAEGSYGKNSSGAERPQSGSACVPTQTLTSCTSFAATVQKRTKGSFRSIRTRFKK